MAVIAHRVSAARVLSAALIFVFTSAAAADQATDIRSRLNEVASSLTAGNPAEAMTPFSKSFANYEKLRDDFTGLTGSFSIVNEVDVLDEHDSKAESVATISWAITLTDPQNNFNTQRSAEIHVRFVREKGKWKIGEFSPIAIFDPSQAQTPSK